MGEANSHRFFSLHQVFPRMLARMVRKLSQGLYVEIIFSKSSELKCFLIVFQLREFWHVQLWHVLRLWHTYCIHRLVFQCEIFLFLNEELECVELFYIFKLYLKLSLSN